MRLNKMILIVLLLSGCATPVTVLKNPKTGQIERCGGEYSGSLVGGAIGYNIQKGSDDSCVKDFKAQGFKDAK